MSELLHRIWYLKAWGSYWKEHVSKSMSKLPDRTCCLERECATVWVWVSNHSDDDKQRAECRVWVSYRQNMSPVPAGATIPMMMSRVQSVSELSIEHVTCSSGGNHSDDDEQSAEHELQDRRFYLFPRGRPFRRWWAECRVWVSYRLRWSGGGQLISGTLHRRGGNDELCTFGLFSKTNFFAPKFTKYKKVFLSHIKNTKKMFTKIGQLQVYLWYLKKLTYL